jgi:glycosyltransferase involved in cell wall biosynthesis
MAAYGGSYSGSFIPMLEAARAAVEQRGWSYQAVFTHGAEQPPWQAELHARKVGLRVAPEMGVRAATAWLRRFLAEQAGPTVLHTHFSRWDIPAVLATCRRRDTAVIWHLHTRLSDELVVRTRNLVRFGVAGRLIDRILCVAPEIRDKAVARLAPSQRTQVFPNAIDVSRYAPIPAAERAEARARFDFPIRSALLLVFAWDWETKGGPLLMGTVQELLRRGRTVHAIVVGSEDRARGAAAHLGLKDAVHPTPPVLDARMLYGAADIFVAASLGEGMPFALLEAIACGTPVVASDIAGHRFAGGMLTACRLVPRLPTAFADAIEAELAAGVRDRTERLAQSRAVIERDFSLERWSQRLVHVYDEVLPH